jgi:hypothetical protein
VRIRVRRARPASALLAAGLALAAAACIERASSVRARRVQFDYDNVKAHLAAARPSPRFPSGAVFDEAVELVGMDLDPPELKPNADFKVTLSFRVIDEPDEDWKLFIHIDDRDGRAARMGRDHEPCEGEFPTDVWRKGDFVKDSFTFRVGPASVEAYEIWVGFYRGEDRWRVSSPGRSRHDGSNRILAATLPMR